MRISETCGGCRNTIVIDGEDLPVMENAQRYWQIEHTDCGGLPPVYVEVAETRSQRACNVYLAAGYRLLSNGIVHVQRRARVGDQRADPVDGKITERAQQYVVGRTAEVPALNLRDVLDQIRGPLPRDFPEESAADAILKHYEGEPRAGMATTTGGLPRA